MEFFVGRSGNVSSVRVFESRLDKMWNNQIMNTLTLGDVNTSSDKEFHGFTTLTAKLFLRNSRRDRVSSEI